MELSLEQQGRNLKAIVKGEEGMPNNERLFYFSSGAAAADAREVMKMLMWIDQNTLGGE